MTNCPAGNLRLEVLVSCCILLISFVDEQALIIRFEVALASTTAHYACPVITV